MKIIQEKNIIKITVQGKSESFNIDKFDSEKFTKYLIDNSDEIINSKKSEIDAKDSEHLKYIKSLFKDIKPREEDIVF